MKNVVSYGTLIYFREENERKIRKEKKNEGSKRTTEMFSMLSLRNS